MRVPAIPVLLATLGTLWTPIAPLARAQTAQPVTVFVVRHAEKGPENPDPSLTAEGATRAEQLADMLQDAGVSHVFVSQFKRTQETGKPLADRLGLVPTTIDARDVPGLISTLKALPAGARALVVSHSNLVPAIVEGLTGQKIGELTDADYDRIYVASVPASGPGGVLYLHFGAQGH